MGVLICKIAMYIVLYGFVAVIWAYLLTEKRLKEREEFENGQEAGDN